ncbi:MAG: CapA family protein [Bacteroidota bacterium]
MKKQNKNLLPGVILFLGGDVMTGRGIDQILPHSVDTKLYESFVKDAREYVYLAEKENGHIEQPVNYKYIWGDAINVWQQKKTGLKIINLETAITNHHIPFAGKGIHYRMHPKNIKILTTAGINVCSLANNHILDWGKEGLIETIKTLKQHNIAYTGAEKNAQQATEPVSLEIDNTRIAILGVGAISSGIPESWEATSKKTGVNLITKLNTNSIYEIEKQLQAHDSQDIIILSIHWGGNWGYDIPDQHQQFAHRLIDSVGADIVYGHSSHHPKGIEVYKDRPIIYGAGDFINDYEGIGGYKKYRGDLTLMYFPTINPTTGKLISLELFPMKIKNFSLHHASESDAEWLFNMLNREGLKLNTSVMRTQNHSFKLYWK